jgi:hypothetical protein
MRADPPSFILGIGKTPVPQLSVEQCKIIVAYILRDEAISLGRERQRTIHPNGREEVLSVRAVGTNIRYHGMLPKWCRGSDRVERIYASVRLLMRAGLSQVEACRRVAASLHRRLGTSKRGRPRHHAEGGRDYRQPWHSVRSLFNSFSRRNPFANENSADFVDAITEKWFQYGLALAYWEQTGEFLVAPNGWVPDEERMRFFG